jgi:hypothetical protein
LKVQLTEPQADFVFSDQPYPAMIAGFGSGKSQAATLRLVHLAASDPGIDVSHFFPTYRLAKRRGLTGAMDHLRALKIPYKVNKSDLTIYLPTLDSTIYLETYSDPDAIVSFEVGHIVVDELDTLPKEQAEYVWQKIVERARQKTRHQCGNTIGCVTTPDQGTAGFCYDTWGDGQHIDNGYHYIKAGTRSNKFLPQGYADQIALNYDPIMAEAFLEGSWVSFTRNKVYHFFNRTKHHTDRLLTDSDTVLHVGLDFNVGGTCATVWVIQDNMPIAVDEFVSQHTQDFLLKVARYKRDGRRIIIYPDASGDNASTNASMTDIQLIRSAGYAIDAPASNPDIRDSVNACNSLFSHDKIKINTTKCQRLTNAVESQGYDKKGKPEKFDEHPSVDDWNDGMRYFINRKFPIIRPMTRIQMAGH